MVKRYKSKTLKLTRNLGVPKFIACLLISLISHGIYAQQVTLSGKVTDANDNEGIPGVNVLNKGAGGGAITDIEGNFTIQAEVGQTLSFSFIGYITKEVTVGSQTVINVSMETDIQQLTEVVVIGYGSVEKKDVTGVIASVDAKQFNRGIIGSPDKLLTGKVAGLQINSDGDPGSATKIRLRGVSINGEQPLFVVDGVPLDKDDGIAGGRNPLNFINPNDVENVTVLKDASAAAIYGSRGANGVIIITTKNGEQGKMKISYDGSYTRSQFRGEHGNFSANNFRAAIFDKEPGELANLGEVNTDWVDEVTQIAQGSQHNLSVSGGSKSTNYFASLNHLSMDGVMKNTSNKTTSLSLKLNQKLFNNSLTIRANTKTGITKDEFSPSVIGDAMSMDPTRPVYDADSEFGGFWQWNDALAVGNPVATQMQNDQEGETIRSLSKLELEYQLPFIDGLSLFAIGSYNYTDGDYQGIKDARDRNQVINEKGIQAIYTDESKKTKLLETYAAYKWDLGDQSNVNLTAGYSWQNFRKDRHDFEGDSAQLVNGEYIINDTTKNLRTPVENRLISFYARAIVDLKGKYLLTASLRRDGSTKFGESNKWGLFPAAAIAWRVLDEDFASSWGLFSDLKLRVGYGVTGNQDIDNYKYNTFYKYSQPDAAYQFGDDYVLTLRPKGVDPDLKWEETVSTNFGVDMGLFDGRLNMSLDYYIKDVNDLLYDVAVPAGSNLSDRVLTNIGRVQNRGIEFTVDTWVMDTENFRWDLSYNLSTNKNEVKQLDNSKFDPTFGGYPRGGITGDVGQTISVLKVGEEIDAFKVYEQRYDETGFPIYSTTRTEMYVDQNDDDIINEEDLVVKDGPSPSLLMGLTSNMAYKGFNLAFTVRANMGNYVYNNVASSTGYFERLTDRTTNNIHESAYQTGFKTRQLHSDYYIEDASFVKLDNVTLSYTFTDLKFATVKTYVTAQNIMTISGYSGVQPEIFDGIDNNLYPLSTTLIFGLNVNF